MYIVSTCILVLYLFVVTGCGGGSVGTDSVQNTDESENEQNTVELEDVEDVTVQIENPEVIESSVPITPYNQESVFERDDLTVKFEAGHFGDIRHQVTQLGHVIKSHTLVLGVPSLNIVDISKKTNAKFNCKNEREIYSYTEDVIYDFLNEY